MKRDGRSSQKHYARWRAMISRCYNEKDKGFKYYGLKGVKVCDEWKNNYWAFHKWCEENNVIDKTTVISRYNDEGDYTPSNCAVISNRENSAQIKITPARRRAAKIAAKKAIERVKKKVRCVETGVIYESTFDAERALGLKRSSVSNAARGHNGQKTSGGYHWKYIESEREE